MRRLYLCLLLLWSGLTGLHTVVACAATGGVVQKQALRTVAHQGSFPAALFLPDGTALLLWDQGDGVRLLHTDGALTQVLSQLHLGATGDHATELAADGAGGAYFAGTSASGQLAGTSGAAFPAPADMSLNPFVGRLDQSLQLSFLSFLGAGRTSLAAMATGGGQAVLTGVTYGSSFPITPGALQTTPAVSSAGTGYVAAFSTAGQLVYATYLSGVDGNTAPASVVVRADGAAIIAGSTASATFPTMQALQGRLPGAASGFLTALSPGGDRLLFSTYIAGAGLRSVAFDDTRQQIVATGDLSFGSFSLANAPEPVANTPYQGLLRVSGDGQVLLDARLLLPGQTSRVTTASDGTPWITGQLSFPPTQQEMDAGTGDHYLLHLDLGGHVDALTRFGGNAANHSESATLQVTAGAPAMTSSGNLVLVPASVTATTSVTNQPTQGYLLPLTPPSGSVAADDVTALVPSDCTQDPCSGSGGLLLMLGAGSTQPAIALDTASSGLLSVHNLSSLALKDLTLSGPSGSVASTCSTTLQPAGSCAAALPTGTGAGLQISADGISPIQVPPATMKAQTDTPALDRGEVNFGLVSAASGTAQATLRLTNLTAGLQTFSLSATDLPTGAPYSIAADGTSCQAANAATYQLQVQQACALTLHLDALSSATVSSGLVHGVWRAGGRDLPITGYLQTAAEALSAVSFSFDPSAAAGSPPLPRFLYVSNLSTSALVHTPIEAPSSSHFDVADGCPELLQPASVCQIVLLYQPENSPALDSTTLIVDGTAVLLSAETVGAANAATTSSGSSITVTPQAVTFQTSVLAATVSQEVQTLELHNGSTVPVALQIGVLGDFALLQNSCPATLAAGAACSIDLLFTPSIAGQREGMLTVTAAGEVAVRVPLLGTGSALTDMPSLLLLGETTVGEPLVAWYRVSSSSVPLTAAVSGDGWSVALVPDFDGTSPTVSPATFAASSSLACTQCWIGIRFLPDVAGPAAGTLTLAASSTGQPYKVQLRAQADPAAGLLLTPATAELPATPVGFTSEPAVLTLSNALSTPVNAALLGVTLDAGLQQAGDQDSFDCGSLLQPGEACSLRITAAPTAEGASTPGVHVHTDQGDVEASLATTGTAPPALRASPEAVQFTAAGTTTVQLHNGGPDPLVVQAATATSTSFQVTSACATLAPDASCTVEVRYQPANTLTHSLLDIAYTAPDLAGASETLHLQVALGGTTSASTVLAAFPASIDYGPGALGVPGEQRVIRIRNQMPSPVSIHFAASHDFPLALLPTCDQIAPGATCEVSVIFLPQASGTLNGTLVASASSADGATLGFISVPLHGYATGAGALQAAMGATPDGPANFGTATSGQTLTQQITLRNPGPDTVSVEGVTTAAPFHVLLSSCAGALASGATCSLTIQYAPSLILQAGADASHAPRRDRATLLVESTTAGEVTPVYLQGSVTPTVVPAPGETLPNLVVDQSALTFAGVDAGASAQQTLTLTNTGTVPATVQQLTVTGAFRADTDCTVLAPGETCSIAVRFDPESTTAELTAGSLLVASDAAHAVARVTLLGTTTQQPLLSSTASLNFGEVAVGTTAQQTATLTNPGPLPVALQSAGPGQPFALTGGTCLDASGFLAAGVSCTVQVTFAPTSAGAETDTLSWNAPPARGTLQIALSGTGITGRLATDQSLLDFGSVLVGASSTLTLHVRNSGLAPLTLPPPQVQGSGAAQFQVVPCSAATLAAGTGCDLLLRFTPTAVASAQASLVLAPGNQQPIQVTLLGTGVEQPGIVLTADGSSSASRTLSAGDTANVSLAVAARGGFTGNVRLTCTAVQPAHNATCLATPGVVSLMQGTATAAASVTTASGYLASAALPFGLLLLRRKKRTSTASTWRRTALASLCLLTVLMGCSDRPVGAPYTPSGTYQYRIDAVAVDDSALQSSVLLTISVH